MGSPQSQSGHFGEEINLLPLPGFKPHTVLAHSIVTTLTLLPCLQNDTVFTQIYIKISQVFMSLHVYMFNILEFKHQS